MNDLQAALRQLLEIESRMTPGPWESNHGLWVKGCGRLVSDGPCIADNDGIAAARNALRPLVEALLACLDEIRVRRDCTPESDAMRVERDTAVITDEALQRMADALGVPR